MTPPQLDSRCNNKMAKAAVLMFPSLSKEALKVLLAASLVMPSPLSGGAFDASPKLSLASILTQRRFAIIQEMVASLHEEERMQPGMNCSGISDTPQ
jgi:hypothetical protein